MSSEPERLSARPVRCSVAAFIVRDTGEFLAVRRPPDDEHLPDVWGLPAVTLRGDELPEHGLRRLGHQKLAVHLEPLGMVGIKAGDRGSHVLILMDLSARLTNGEPDVRQAPGPGTTYVDQQWTSRYDILVPAASRGSLCCQILLDSRGIPYTTLR